MDISLVEEHYKSITPPLDWPDIPPFAILTGENGTGKTQWLQAIAGHLNPPRGTNPFAFLKFSFSNSTYQAHEVVFFPDMSNRLAAGATSLVELTQEIRQLHQRSRQTHDAYERAVLSQISALPANDSSQSFPSSLLYYNPSILPQSVARHFVNYWIDYVNLKIKDHDHANCLAMLGAPPWDVINQLLDGSGFPYNVTSPVGLDLRAHFSLRFRHRDTNIEVSIDDLSTGESTLVRLYLWLFVANQKFSFPKFILLDEPDSHLHPTLIKTFVSSLRDGLVGTLGCRVIMTTHRSETIAFVPEDAVYEMHTDIPRIRKSTGIQSTLFLLTNNLVGILVEDKRPVFVEDEADVKFYRRVLDVLAEDFQWNSLTKPEFIAASFGEKSQRTPGGKENVRKIVNKLITGGLRGPVKGLIDRDDNNAAEDRILVLDRYSLENFLLDPIIVYGMLIDLEIAIPLRLEPPLRAGETSRLRDRRDDELQQITDIICGKIASRLQPKVDESETARQTVEYTNGKTITLPRWFFDRRGHDLFQAFRGEWPSLRREELLRAYSKVRLVPRSLQRVLQGCVG